MSEIDNSEEVSMSEIDVDIECHRCNDTGFITVRNTYPMTYVCAGSPPDSARGVAEARCDRCDPVARFIDESEDDE